MDEIFGALLAAVIEPFLAVIGHLLLNFLILVVAYPLLCVVLTPLFLVFSLFGKGDYRDKVRSSYTGLWKAMI